MYSKYVNDQRVTFKIFSSFVFRALKWSFGNRVLWKMITFIKAVFFHLHVAKLLDYQNCIPC